MFSNWVLANLLLDLILGFDSFLISHTIWHRFNVLFCLLIFEDGVDIFLSFFYCILGFGVHVQNMQDSCIGTHMSVCSAAFLPFTHVWHFSPGYFSPAPPPYCPSPIPPNRPQCLVLPSLCPCVLIFHYPPMSEDMQYFILCSCVSLLRMMFSRFIHVPTNDTNSSFLIAA